MSLRDGHPIDALIARLDVERLTRSTLRIWMDFVFDG
jgi:hypothetical protein